MTNSTNDQRRLISAASRPKMILLTRIDPVFPPRTIAAQSCRPASRPGAKEIG
jgi:hypothetical protein